MARPHADLMRLAKGSWRSAEADPHGLVVSAADHRMEGLLQQRIASEGDPGLSWEDRWALGRRNVENRARHARLWSALGEVMDLLAPLGVSPIVIKGVAAEAQWYDGDGERPTGDLDLVLAPGDLPALPQVLAALGVPTERREVIQALVERRSLQHAFVRFEGVGIDMHFDPLKIGVWCRSAAEMAERTATVVGRDGVDVRVLASEDQLISFLTHLNKDRFAYLGAFVDVARVVERAEIDWDLFAATVATEGLEVPVYRSLAVVAETLELDAVPALVPPRVRAAAWDRLWPEPMRLKGLEGRTSNPRRQVAMTALLRGRSVDALRELRRQLMPDAALLDLQSSSPADHSYVRRVTLDRLTARTA